MLPLFLHTTVTRILPEQIHKQHMSDFQRNIFQNRLKQAEQKLGFNFDESLEDSDPEDANLITSASTTTTTTTTTLSSTDIEDEETSLDWSDAFETNDIYCNSEGYCFQTYFKKPSINKSATDDDKTPVLFIGHHGAGSSGLTFAELSRCISSKSESLNYFTNPGFFTFDMRGHGNTNLINKNNAKLDEMNYQLSIETLEADFIFIFNHFIKKFIDYSPQKFTSCSIFLLGHSLGGSVLTKVLHNYTKNDNQNGLDPAYAKFIKGLTIIDIVEDTAINALNSMDSYLNNMPSSFPSLKAAIEWHNTHGLRFNKSSCRFTIPSILYKDNGVYKFIIDLKKSEPYWSKWFIGLSGNFITIPNSISKLLILANNDYLDKDLIIGQMQGKYQLIVFRSDSTPHANLENIMSTITTTINVNDSTQISHFIQEDVPNKMAISLLEFVERNDNGTFHKAEFNPQLDLINRLNKKWNVKK